MPDPTHQAVRNNALWCDAVCRAHGRPGRFLDELWTNERATPPFYPNAITLAGTPRSTEQLAHIGALIDARIPGNWAVKDSFAALDLAPLGFRVLFDAQWIYRPGSPAPAAHDAAGVRWERVGDVSALAAWERAWAGESDGSLARIFLPPLLAEKDIAILAAYHHEAIVAGVIANHTADVVGASNLFVPADDDGRYRAGCLAAITGVFLGLPLVGYESGPDLAAALALGFEAIGPLRVWGRDDASKNVNE